MRWWVLAPGFVVTGCLAFSPLDNVNRDEEETERTPSECSDFFDNDGDGPIDCDDDSCCGVQFCRDVNPSCTDSTEEAGQLCVNGVDDDADGDADCEDDSCCKHPKCVLAPRCIDEIPEGETDCFDGRDNDGNEAIDCEDVACCREAYCASWSPACGNEVVETGELCYDELDNDDDGFGDCQDYKCCGEDHCSDSEVCAEPFPIETCPELPRASDPFVDDMEDGDPLIATVDGRSGAWVAVNDQNSYGDQNVAHGEFIVPEETTRSAENDDEPPLYAIHTFGDSFPTRAGALMTLVDPAPNPACFTDLSKFVGVRFDARGTPLRVVVHTAQTTPTYLGGLCEGGPEICSDAFGVDVVGDSGGDGWATREVFWDDFQRRDWVPGALAEHPDVTQVSAIEFAAADPGGFDFWIDNVYFIE